MSSFLRYYSAHNKRIFPNCVVLKIASNTSAVWRVSPHKYNFTPLTLKYYLLLLGHTHMRIVFTVRNKPAGRFVLYRRRCCCSNTASPFEWVNIITFVWFTASYLTSSYCFCRQIWSGRSSMWAQLRVRSTTRSWTRFLSARYRLGDICLYFRWASRGWDVCMLASGLKNRMLCCSSFCRFILLVAALILASLCFTLGSHFCHLLCLPSTLTGRRPKHGADSWERRRGGDSRPHHLHLPGTGVHPDRLLCQQWIHRPWTTGKPPTQTRLHSGTTHAYAHTHRATLLIAATMSIYEAQSLRHVFAFNVMSNYALCTAVEMLVDTMFWVIPHTLFSTALWCSESKVTGNSSIKNNINRF